jgi:hypothetical protein
LAADSNTNSFASVAAVTEPALELCTCKLPSGDARLPTLTLPFDAMRSLSVPPVSAVNVSAAGNLNFVFVSPR